MSEAIAARTIRWIVSKILRPVDAKHFIAIPANIGQTASWKLNYVSVAILVAAAI
jgi:hypothetical protein